MLMDLSRSLRTQLYESHHKSSPALQEPTSREFDLHSPVLDLLTERRYHILRHVIMVCWFIFITANDLLFDNSHRYLDVFLPLFSFIILIYFNLYVLVPKFMLRGKAKAYLAWAALSVVVVATPALMFYLQQVQLSFWSSLFFFIGSLFKLSLPIFGVSVLVLFRQWVLNERRIAELNTATLLSELEQLQNQVNPHFLFNMLNNIIVLVKTAPKQGADVIRKLNDMLKYQFHGSARQTIRLGDDIHFLNDYLNLEKLRRDRFEFHISAEPGMEHITLPPLLFIPFVENAVKHSNTNSTPSYVNLKFTRKADALLFTCVNSKPQPPLRKGQAGGLGLLNIRRRLDLLYGEGYDLNITENDISYTVRLSIELKPEKP